MDADPETSTEIEALIRETYRRMSTPGADPSELSAHDDMTVAGSGQGELMTTGVFVRDAEAWHWRYWGGAEPQAEPRV